MRNLTVLSLVMNYNLGHTDLHTNVVSGWGKAVGSWVDHWYNGQRSLSVGSFIAACAPVKLSSDGKEVSVRDILCMFDCRLKLFHQELVIRADCLYLTSLFLLSDGFILDL